MWSEEAIRSYTDTKTDIYLGLAHFNGRVLQAIYAGVVCRFQVCLPYVRQRIDRNNGLVSKCNKWRAEEAQTARCRSKVRLLSIPYIYYFMAYQKKAVERKTNHLLKSRTTRSQASRKGHWLFCVSKQGSARSHEYVGLIEIMFPATLHGVGVITKLYFVIFCDI